MPDYNNNQGPGGTPPGFPGNPKRSLPTADVFAAAINRLNRQSVGNLLGQLTEAVSSCAEEMADESRITQLVDNRISSYNYTNAISSLVTLVGNEISNYDFSNSNNTNLGIFIDNRINNYDLSNNRTFNTIIDNRINNHDLSSNSTFNTAVSNVFSSSIANYNLATNTSLSAAIDARVKNYNLVTNNSFNASIDARVTRFDFSNSNTFNNAVATFLANYNLASHNSFNTSIDSRISNYNFSTVIDSRLTSFDFGGSVTFNNAVAKIVGVAIANYNLTNNATFNSSVDSRIASYNYNSIIDSRISSYDFSSSSTFNTSLTQTLDAYNLANNATFNSLIDSRVNNYNLANNATFNSSADARIRNYNLASNVTFNSSVDSRIASYDFTNVFNSRLASYDFTTNAVFASYIDARLASYDLSRNSTFSALIDQRLRSFDFSSNTSLIGIINASTSSLRQDVTNINNALAIQAGNLTKLQTDVANINNNNVGINITLSQHTAQIAALNSSLGNITDLTAIQQQIQSLQTQIAQATVLAGELDGQERAQVIEIFNSILSQESYAEQIINNFKIEVNGQRFTLVNFLSVLFNADAVANVSIQYNEYFIDGCVYTLTDGVNVVFKCQRREDPDGTLTYDFQTSNWKGLNASFQSKFARIKSPTYKVCKKEISIDWYEPISNSNLVFSLLS